MKQVLVVDDSAVIRKVARRILENLNFRTFEAENGQEALAICADSMPDVVLLDWNMPVMNGYDFIKALRQLPSGSQPKVVFCTTENEAGHIARAMHAGADEYLMKPFDQYLVRSKLREIGLV